MKTCVRCHVCQDASCFPPRKTNSDGLYSYCRSCIKKEYKERYIRDKEKIATKSKERYLRTIPQRTIWSKQYYLKNRKKILQKSEIYRKNNKEKISLREATSRINDPDRFEKNRKRHYKWASKNREKLSEYAREWYQKNKEKRRANVILNRAVKSGVLQRPNICEECKKEAKIEGHHEDYSNPLNVKWLCKPCHSRKSPRTVIKLFT